MLGGCGFRRYGGHTVHDRGWVGCAIGRYTPRSKGQFGGDTWPVAGGVVGWVVGTVRGLLCGQWGRVRGSISCCTGCGGGRVWCAIGDYISGSGIPLRGADGGYTAHGGMRVGCAIQGIIPRGCGIVGRCCLLCGAALPLVGRGLRTLRIRGCTIHGREEVAVLCLGRHCLQWVMGPLSGCIAHGRG